MGRVLLLRHGQSTWNAEGRWQGWADPPLSPAGVEQAKAAAVVLADAGIELVAASDLRRARETAEIVARALGLGEVVVEPGIRERDVGDWSGLVTAEIETRWPGMLDAWREGRLDALPGGEGDITERVMAGVHRLLQRAGDRTVLAVSHGGVIRSVIRRLGGDPERIGNVGGRWVEGGDGDLRLGPPVVYEDPSGPPARTTVL